MSAAIPIALGALILIPVGIVAVLYLIVPAFKGLGWLIRQVARFITGEIGDALRIVGALITQVVFIPIILVNLVIGRWSASAHFGRAVSAEFKTLGACVYRIVVGHPARLLCLTALTEGLEKRVPAAMAAAPGADAPSAKRSGQFEGYTIVGSLPGGGSGGKLYVAEPDAIRLASFERAGQRGVRQVVIKTFSLRDGSSLPQIVRESRALDAAKKLGLVLDHELTGERFFYVMRYVPGESLGLVTQRLHASCGGDGLTGPALSTAMAYGVELLRTLQAYHAGGLWHKDVKPDNIIVDGRSAHLVDFGLVTPLRSAMTLTTHGTEYFRDPEMVRQALKGVKVDQVDGAKFDLYAAGAVIFSVIENSFPAHGGLSQISKRCPEALRWVVRRAMTDYDKRYTSAGAMLADLEVIRRAPDPFSVKPFELPSMKGFEEPLAAPAVVDHMPLRHAPEPVRVGDGSDQYSPKSQPDPVVMAAAGSPMPASDSGPRRRPRLRVNRWWTGGYVAEDAAGSVPAGAGNGGGDKTFFAKWGPVEVEGQIGWPHKPGVSAPVRDRHEHPRSARDQREAARARVKAARERAHTRQFERRKHSSGDFGTMNIGVGLAVLILLAAVAALFFGVSRRANSIAPRITFGSGDEMRGFAHGTLPGDGVLVEASRADGPRLEVNGRTVSATTPASASAVSGERALVISDITPAPASVASAAARLKTAGFALLGNYPGNTADSVEIRSQLDLEAGARQIRAMESLEQESVIQRLSDWLSEQRDIDLLVWFARAGEEGDLHYFVVTPTAKNGARTKLHKAVFDAGVTALAGRVN